MDITIDITRGIDHDGIARRYYPTIHWILDEQDSISPDTMRKIADRLKNELEEGLYIEG